MKKYEVFILGHISLDEIQEFAGRRYPFYGGAVLFSSFAAHAMEAKVGILTKMVEKERILMDVLPLAKEECYFLPSPENTSLLNAYLDPLHERREITATSLGEQIKFSELPTDVESEIFHLGGLIYGDFEDGIIEKLSQKGKVAVDLQSYLRCVNPDTKQVFFQDYEHKKRDLPHIHFLKADAAEAEILTGLSDREAAAKQMYEWGSKEIFITHNTELLVYDGTQTYTMPLRPRNLTGRTGRGDTSFSVYITQRLHKSILESMLWSAGAVSLKMEHPEPLKHSKKQIHNYIVEQYPDYLDLLTE